MSLEYHSWLCPSLDVEFLEGPNGHQEMLADLINERLGSWRFIESSRDSIGKRKRDGKKTFFMIHNAVLFSLWHVTSWIRFDTTWGFKRRNDYTISVGNNLIHDFKIHDRLSRKNSVWPDMNLYLIITK